MGPFLSLFTRQFWQDAKGWHLTVPMSRYILWLLQFYSASCLISVPFKPASISQTPRKDPAGGKIRSCTAHASRPSLQIEQRRTRLVKNENDDKMSNEARVAPLTTCSYASQLNKIASRKNAMCDNQIQ